jgi:hypothetical protein
MSGIFMRIVVILSLLTEIAVSLIFGIVTFLYSGRFHSLDQVMVDNLKISMIQSVTPVKSRSFMIEDILESGPRSLLSSGTIFSDLSFLQIPILAISLIIRYHF